MCTAARSPAARAVLLSAAAVGTAGAGGGPGQQRGGGEEGRARGAPPVAGGGGGGRDLSAALRQLLEAEGVAALARNNSMAVWVAVSLADGSTARTALGCSAAEQPPPTAGGAPAAAAAAAGGVCVREARTDDLIPAGSLTKTFTAAAIMRLVEQGALDLDADTVTARADRFLAALAERTRYSNVSLQTIFNPMVANASLRTVLSMRSGLPVYSGSAVRKAGEVDSWRDLTPQDYLFADPVLVPHKGSWRCKTTACLPPQYNSMNYMLLGLVLAQHLNLTRWEELDQLRAALPPALIDKYADDVVFFQHGPCSRYGPRVAHYYDWETRGGVTGFYDQHNTSCLNGWAFGNIGITVGGAAAFLLDLVGPSPKVVSPESALEMQQFGEVLANHRWERYGLGLMWLPLRRYGLLDVNVSGTEPYRYAVGHNGCDFGTWTHSAYHPGLQLASGMALNKEAGLRGAGGASIKAEHIFCLAYRAIFRLVGRGAVGDRAFRACAPR